MAYNFERWGLKQVITKTKVILLINKCYIFIVAPTTVLKLYEFGACVERC